MQQKSDNSAYCLRKRPIFTFASSPTTPITATIPIGAQAPGIQPIPPTTTLVISAIKHAPMETTTINTFNLTTGSNPKDIMPSASGTHAPLGVMWSRRSSAGTQAEVRAPRGQEVHALLHVHVGRGVKRAFVGEEQILANGKEHVDGAPMSSDATVAFRQKPLLEMSVEATEEDAGEDFPGDTE
nr:unnamed protein product [Spirometra erinaceieuropaei]